MFLKTLTLKGFKSFADTTALELEPGVTVVVGPNGSGKSNVVDAIGWVLGAQAPSAVRSQKMDDVIFAGTTKRPALGRAEVALTIDNSAGLLPIDFTEVTITRTLFRSGDSEYALNGVPCRLLDIQELLSDSGIGRTQHVIVSQGQLDDVLKAHPSDRRMIVEEAAGILKYRKRKEKAERRLAATEANLLRLQDLTREVRRQLRPLERQADAARRHGSLVDELTALRLHVAGREIESTRARLAAAARDRGDLAGQEKELRTRLGDLDAAVVSAESSLTAAGADDLGDTLSRWEGLRERARGLVNLIAERRRSLERDRGALLDAGVVATLEAESARLARELEEVEAEGAQLVPAARELEEAERALVVARAEFDERWGGDEPVVSGRAAEVRGELSALGSSVEQAVHEADRLRARIASLREKDTRLVAEADRLRAEVAAADAAEPPLLTELDDSESRRQAAEHDVASAEAAVRAADADQQRWAARAEALALALDDARDRAGASRLDGVDGVVGTVLDLVAVEPGWERAFEAALGEALHAVIVRDAAAGRRALARLREGDSSGAVLALDGASSVSSPIEITGAEPLAPRVRADDPVVESMLRRLLAPCAVVDGGWTAALDASLAHPHAVVVTRDGDRFTGRGWRVGLAGPGATAAALDEARDRASVTEADAVRARNDLDSARQALAAARESEVAIGRRLDENDGRLAAAGDALQRLESERRDVATEVDALSDHLHDLDQRRETGKARQLELGEQLSDLEAEEQAAAAAVADRRRAEEALAERARAVGTLRSDLEVRGAAIDDRRRFLTGRRGEVEARLAADEVERAGAQDRRHRTETAVAVVDRLVVVAQRGLDQAEERLGDLRELRRRQSEVARQIAGRLDGLRRERSMAERALEELRERERRIEIDETETRVRLEGLTETLRHDLDVEPDDAVGSPCPDLAEGVKPAARVRELERELKLMGPVNPLALEEFEALQERHEFLQGQLDDVKSTRRDLAKVIRAVDEEIVEVFAAAFADVAENFTYLFSTLFPGGTGKLRLTEPDDLLATGIEIEGKPAGKNVKKLSLLSGGERSLTALAFLFAVFRSRPSPFYVLDEVEAALDDLNLHRFLELVDEFRREAQLVIVSHQKRTMEAADCLYGVSMQPGGSSKVVSERLSAS